MARLTHVVDVCRARVLRPAVIAAALGVIDAALVAAQPESPRFIRLSVEQGLSQSSVQQILQDRKGLIWFGTQEGLNRYDGYRFTVHRARDREGFLRDHDITALIEDARGDLWVGTSMGLYRHDLDTGRFDACAPPVDGLGIRELVQSGSGLIYFAASDGRLWAIDPADPDRRARALHDGAFAALTDITALARGAGSAIWVAANGRIFSVNLPNATPRAPPDVRSTEVLRDVGAVSVMVTDSRGDLWIGRPDAELLRYRPADGRVDRFPQAPRYTLAILPGKGGEIWIGARGEGLSRLEPDTGQVLVYRHDPEDTASLSSDDVGAIHEDALGSLWIGCWNGGVNRFDPHAQAFRTFRHRARVPESLPADDVIAMTESPDGSLWLASRSGIVAAGDPRTGRFRTAATHPGRGRLTAVGSFEDRILVGTSRGLAVLARPSGLDVTPASIATLGSIDSNGSNGSNGSSGSIGASGDSSPLHELGERPIAEIRSAPGVAWIAAGNALYRITRDAAPGAASGAMRVERFDVPIAGMVSTLSTLSPDAAGRLWIGSDRGEVVRADWSGSGASVVLRRLDIVAPSARDSLAAHGVVSALHEDQHGRLWVGTRRGLGRIELTSGKVGWLGQEDGLPSTNISSIVGGGDGRLWLAHNRGVTRMEPAGGVMTHFGERDGAQGNGYAEGAWAAGESGRIYFAGEGVTAFDPREVGVSPSRPTVVFTALEILHRVVTPRWLDPGSPLERAIDAQREITLDAGATVFSVEMAPLHYADPPSNRLRYRLDGFDPEWIETDAHNRVATYTNLAPGRYVLRARAGTKNGVWSAEDATLAIHLLPPWWRTSTALAGWFGLALAAVGVIRRERRRRARVKAALLEREALRRDSLTDPLTGLHNRRFLISWLEQEMPKLAREHRANGAASGADLLLLLIDVDHFKSINDRHSHGAGDRVLSLIAGVLKEHIRGSDLAVRWGGDEFLVVTRSVQRDRASDSAARLRAAVEALGPTLVAENGSASTVSIGFAAFPFLPREPDALSWEQTLELADHALRLTKRRHRNSYTGLRAAAGLTAASVLAFLAGRGAAPLPEAVEILTPDEPSL
jgi:diguanylate cyclase (GGDEF)-like protein